MDGCLTDPEPDVDGRRASVRNMRSMCRCSCVLQFTFRRAVSCDLHRPPSQVIHCIVLSFQFSFGFKMNDTQIGYKGARKKLKRRAKVLTAAWLSSLRTRNKMITKSSRSTRYCTLNSSPDFRKNKASTTLNPTGRLGRFKTDGF